MTLTNYSLELFIGLLAFLLPLTLLWPGFSIWEVVPKVRVTRHPVLSQQLSWSQLCGAIVVAVTLLFCLFLEMRKRRFVRLMQFRMCGCRYRYYYIYDGM